MEKSYRVPAWLSVLGAFALALSANANTYTFANTNLTTATGSGQGNYQLNTTKGLQIMPNVASAEGTSFPAGTLLRLKNLMFCQQSGYAAAASPEYLLIDGISSGSRTCDTNTMWTALEGYPLTYPFANNYCTVMVGAWSKGGYIKGTGSSDYMRLRLYVTTADEYGMIQLHNSMDKYRPAYEILVEDVDAKSIWRRAIAGTGAAWEGTDLWEYDGKKWYSPQEDSDIELFVTNEVENALMVNDYISVSNHTFTVRGDGEGCANRFEISGAGRIKVGLAAALEVDTRIHYNFDSSGSIYGTLDTANASVLLLNDAKLEFDITGLELPVVYSTDGSTFPLTGKIEQDDTRVKLIDEEPEEHADYNIQLEYDAANSRYQLKVKAKRKALELHWCQGASNVWTVATEWYSPEMNRNYTVINGDSLVIDSQAIVTPDTTGIKQSITSLKIDVPEDQYVTITTGLPKNITSFSKSGEGTLYLNGDNSNYTGKFLADGGTVVMGHANALGADGTARELKFTNGAKLDENGLVGPNRWNAAIVVTLDNATLMSSKPAQAETKMAPVQQLILDGDGELNAEAGCAVLLTMATHTSAKFELNGYTLTKTGGGDAYLSCPKFIGASGTFRINNGRVRAYRHTSGDYNTTADLPSCDGTLQIDEDGELTLENYGQDIKAAPDTFTTKNLILDGSAGRAEGVTNGEFVVHQIFSGKGEIDYVRLDSSTATFRTDLGAVKVTKSIVIEQGAKVVFKDSTVRVAPIFRVGDECEKVDFDETKFTYETLDGEAVTDAHLELIDDGWYAVRKGSYLRIR